MAWLAGLASAGIGAASNANDAKEQKKANRNAGILSKEGYDAAIDSISGYEGIGSGAANSLASLLGIEGYRTPEERAYTEFLRSSPELASTFIPRSDLDKNSLLMGPAAWMVNKQADSLADSGSGVLGRGGHFGPLADMVKTKKSRARRQAAANAQNQANYEKQVAEWKAKKAELETASKNSLANYDTMAILRATPGYMTRYDEGLNTAKNAMAGNMLSGNALRGLTEYGQNFASNERGNEIARLAGIAGMGQNAATTKGNWAIGAGGTGTALALQQGQNNANYYGNLNNVAQGTIGNMLEYYNRNSNRPASNNYLYGYGGYGSYPAMNPDTTETYTYAS